VIVAEASARIRRSHHELFEHHADNEEQGIEQFHRCVELHPLFESEIGSIGRKRWDNSPRAN